jgi:hypothetical protein
VAAVAVLGRRNLSDVLHVTTIQMDKRAGVLTVYSADRREIYGEFRDALWDVEKTDGGPNHVFSGTASEGTMETFRRVNAEGIDHVAFDFVSSGGRYSGNAQLLRPEDTRNPGKAWIRIETGTEPVAV